MGKKQIKVMDTSFRDGFQSVYGARVFVEDFIPAIKAAVDAGIRHLKLLVVRDFNLQFFIAEKMLLKRWIKSELL